MSQLSDENSGSLHAELRSMITEKGQMELHVKWLDIIEREVSEEAPTGLIPCSESSCQQVELLEMYKDGLTVTEYWTEVRLQGGAEQQLYQALLEEPERRERCGILLEGGLR